MKLFAILDHRSGLLFPAIYRGSSHYNFPAVPGLSYGGVNPPWPWSTDQKIPRFWLTERAAKSFLTSWCKGALTFMQDGGHILNYIPGSARDRANYSVISVTLTQ